MRRPLTALVGTLFACGAFVVTALPGCAFDWGFPHDDTADAKDEGLGDAPSQPDTFKESSTTDTPPEPPSACKDSKECGASSYCHFMDHRCITGGTPGKCTPFPLGC